MTRVAAITVILAMTPIAVTGHHSNAEYDFTVFEELEGEVVAVSWKNPHVRLTLRSPNAGDRSEIWNLEAQDVNSLGRRGLGPDLIQVGDIVTVAGNPSRRRERALFVTNVLLPNGTEIRARGQTEPRWSAEHIGFATVVIGEVQATAERTTGLFRVWMNNFSQGYASELPLTPAVREAQASWDPDSNLIRKCVVPGMPGAMRMSSFHPIDFVEQGGNIIIRNESFDIVRTIHMQSDGQRVVPPPSALGYSVGRWEGGTLVIRTTEIAWPYFDQIGSIPQTEAVEIIERFSVDDENNQLLYDVTVSDPAVFTEPVSAHWVLEWRPDLVVEPYECTLDG